MSCCITAHLWSTPLSRHTGKTRIYRWGKTRIYRRGKTCTYRLCILLQIHSNSFSLSSKSNFGSSPSFPTARWLLLRIFLLAFRVFTFYQVHFYCPLGDWECVECWAFDWEVWRLVSSRSRPRSLTCLRLGYLIGSFDFSISVVEFDLCPRCTSKSPEIRVRVTLTCGGCRKRGCNLIKRSFISTSISIVRVFGVHQRYRDMRDLPRCVNEWL